MTLSLTSLTSTFVEQHVQAIDAMIEKYSAGLRGPINGVLPSTRAIEPAVVLLTGTTGGLGSFLLAELLRHTAVQRIYALNRPSSRKSIEERQISGFRQKGLSVDLLYSVKLVYIEADTSLEKCGLSPAQYNEILNSVTLIIHNAWPVTFVAPLSAFEESIRASRNLIDLGLGSLQKDNLRFLFTSSIGSGQSWDYWNGPLSEEVILDPSISIPLGYGESKYTTERIIARSGLHATSLRIHQITGGHGGTWSPTNWFPVAIKSSVELGALFTVPGVCSWLRFEEVASIALNIAFSNKEQSPILNVAHPQALPYAKLTAFVLRALVKHKVLRREEDLPLVSFQDWLVLLEEKAKKPSKDDLAKIPAIKLLRFFRVIGERYQRDIERVAGGIRSDTTVMEMMNWPIFSITKARRISPTLENMKVIEEHEVNAWVEHWVSVGFLSEKSPAHSHL